MTQQEEKKIKGMEEKFRKEEGCGHDSNTDFKWFSSPHAQAKDFLSPILISVTLYLHHGTFIDFSGVTPDLNQLKSAGEGKDSSQRDYCNLTGEIFGDGRKQLEGLDIWKSCTMQCCALMS
ncbi:unnamed protein product [Caretta caretta]